MLTFFVYLFIVIALITIFIPTLSCHLIKYWLNLDILNIKMYTLTHYKSFFLKIFINNSIWGISDFVLSIPDIKIKFNLKLFKIIIEINNLQAFFIHNDFHLHQVKIIQGLMEPNLVANLLQFILKRSKFQNQNKQKLIKLYGGLIKKSLSESRTKLKQNQQLNQTLKKGKITTLFQGTFHFLFMMIFQFLQIRLNQNTINFVSSIPNIPQHQLEQTIKQRSQTHINYLSQSNHQLDFKTPYSRKRSLLLLRNLSQQTLKIENLTTKVVIINHFQEQIQVFCPRFQVINWNHPNEHMIRGRQFFLGIKVPFTLQISQSLKSLQYGIRVESLDFNTIPRDYQMVMQMIKSFSFSLDKIQKLFVRGFIEQNSQLKDKDDKQEEEILRQQTSVSVQILRVNLVMQNLYEVNVDQKDAQQYLSNISQARFSLTGICFKSKQFKIQESILKINRFRNISLNKSRYDSASNNNNNTQQQQRMQQMSQPGQSRMLQMAMIKIPNIVFRFYDRQTRINHNPTQLFCGRQQLALLGKLFRLINQRMRFDQLNPSLYLKLFNQFIQFQHHNLIQQNNSNIFNIHNSNKTIMSSKSINSQQPQLISKNNRLQQINLVQLFSYICFIQKPQLTEKSLITQSSTTKNDSNKQTQQSKSQEYMPIARSQQTLFIYQPSSLTFRLLIENLEHTLYLPNCSYKQVIKQQQFQHIISVPSLDLNYHQAKQFGVKDLKMIIRQIPTLNQFALFVDSISMSQNQQTLVEYLNGWIILKKLLQITSDQISDDNQDNTQISVSVNKKLSKKTIIIRKLQLDYEKQKISIKKIQLQKTTLPNDKTIKMYFSLDKCQWNTKLLKRIGYGLKKTPSKTINLAKKYQQLDQKILKTNTNSNNFTSNQDKIKEQFIDSDDKSYIQVVHNLFSFESLTINAKLQNIPKHINKRKSFSIEKQKSLIHLKNPQINLPYFDISKKIFTVFQSYINLKPHINAYIKNKTEDEFIKVQKNIKDFLIEPDCLHLKVTNFSVTVQQQPFNTHLQNYHRFIREFMSKYDPKNAHKLSQIQVISFLKKNKKQSNLCKLSIKEIDCEIQLVSSLANDYKQSIDEWIQLFRKNLEFQKKDFKSSQTLQSRQIRQIRLRKVEAAQYRFGIKNLQFWIRDYPNSILSLSQFGFKIACIKTSNIFNLKNYFFAGDLKFGKMIINSGLNMLSGFLEIRKKIMSYIDIFDKFEKTTDFSSNIKKAHLKKKHSLLIQQKKFQLSYQPWWYILFNYSQWKFHIIKEPTKINLYTGTTPYQKQCFEIVLGNFQCKSQRKNTQLNITDLLIKLFDNKILELQNIMTSYSVFQDDIKNFNVFADIFASNAGKVILSKSTVQYVSTLKQLRNDWLIIYGLYTQNAYDDDEMLHKKQRMNYIELINLTANRMIQEDERNVSFLSAIKQIQLKIKVQEFNLILTNFQQGIQLGIQDFKFDHQIRAIKKIRNQWQTLKSNLQVQRIWGNLQKDNQKSDTKVERLTQHLKQNQENVFLAAKKLKFNFNKYKLLRQGIQNNKHQKQASEIVFIRKFMQLQSIKLAMSLRIKKSIQKLILSFSPQKLKKQFQQKNKKILSENNLTPIEKLKSTVWKVIRINKLKRRKLFGIKHFMFFAQIGNVQAILMSGKNSVMVDSRQNVRLDFMKVYLEDDKNYRSPITKIMLKLLDVEINLLESTQSNITNLLTKNSEIRQKSQQKKLNLSRSQTIELLMHIQSDQLPDRTYSKGNLTLSNGLIELTQKSKSILIQMIQFLVQLTNDKQKKKMEYKKAHQKFNELQNNGRQILKYKIQSSVKDLIEQMNQRLAFKWIFEIKNIIIQLIVPVQEKIKFSIDSVSFLKISKPFIKIDSQLISCELNFFTNQKIQRTFQVNDLTVENLFQNQSSVFRKIVSMNHNDNLALYMTMESIDVTPLSTIVWEYFNSIKIHINPIKFRVTQKLYFKFYQFLFPQEPIQKLQSNQIQKGLIKSDVPQNYQQRFIPDFIQKLQMDDVKVQVWYETQSLLKRMEGISVGLNSYKIQKTFSTKKQIFDQWIKFVLKQMAGQIFNVLGQKIFGSSQNTQ